MTRTIYAQVSVEFGDDPRVVAAGALGELAYLRCLLQSRRLLTDGVIDRHLLDRWLHGIGGKRKRRRIMARLERVGLLDPHPAGWCIPPRVWVKWAPERKDVDALRAERSAAAVRGNHERWHSGATGRPSAACPLCREERTGAKAGESIAKSQTDRKPIASATTLRSAIDRKIANASPESESETDKSQVSTEDPVAPVDNSADGNRMDLTLTAFGRLKAERSKGVRNPSAYARRCATEARGDPAIVGELRRLADLFPDAPPGVIAAAAMGEKHSLVGYRRSDEEDA